MLQNTWALKSSGVCPLFFFFFFPHQRMVSPAESTASTFGVKVDGKMKSALSAPGLISEA